MDRKTFQTSVVAGIVASVLVILIVQPLLRWFWEVFVSGSNLTITYLSDSVYRNAALGHRNWVGAALAILVFAAFSGVVTVKLIVRVLPQGWREAWKEALVKARKGPARAMIVITELCGLFAILWLMTAIYADIQLGTSFEQRLAVLVPHLPDQAVKEIRASWASMENRQDYERIIAHMEGLATDKGIALPRLLLQ